MRRALCTAVAVLVGSAGLTVQGCGSRTALEELVGDGGAPADGADRADGARMPADGEAPGPESGEGDEAGAPLERAYLFDGDGVLYRYETSTRSYQSLGAPDCGDDAVPWTLTVSRENAYILYTDWTLFAVNLDTLACVGTEFVSGQLGLESEFGIAVSAAGGEEQMYFYGFSGGRTILAVSDLTSFALRKVSDVAATPTPPAFPVNLTADTLGNLYAYAPGGLLLQIDAATGAVRAEAETGVKSETTWATLTYGASLYLFAEARVAGYDLGARKTTFEVPIGVAPIGAGSAFPP